MCMTVCHFKIEQLMIFFFLHKNACVIHFDQGYKSKDKNKRVKIGNGSLNVYAIHSMQLCISTKKEKKKKISRKEQRKTITI